MRLTIVCSVVLIAGKWTSGAPVDNASGEKMIENDVKAEDTSQAPNDKNPVVEWFEKLSKNASTSTQNAMNTFKEWFSKLSPNLNGGSDNLPVMYMGSFQLIKMPVPQFTDVIKGVGNLATAAQTINNLAGGLGGGLPIPGFQG